MNTWSLIWIHWQLPVAAIVLAATVVVTVWIPIYNIQEASHYHMTSCSVSNCTITDTLIQRPLNPQGNPFRPVDEKETP